MNDKHIEMRNVRKTYRFFTLDDVSLDLEPGQIMGFVGPNGAGKSTTLRLAMGMISPDAGEIRVLGHEIPRAQAAAKRDIGYVSAEMRLLPHATLGWHMDFMKSIYPQWDGGYATALVKRFNLRMEQNARSLSLGEHVKASLLLALARRPKLLILDEPTTGLDPVARHEVITEFMEVLRDESRSILFSSHNTVDVERIQVQLPAGATLPELPNIVARASDGHFVTLTTNQFSAGLKNLIGPYVTQVQRMNLEEIFVANVMHHREARGL